MKRCDVCKSIIVNMKILGEKWLQSWCNILSVKY